MFRVAHQKRMGGLGGGGGGGGGRGTPKKRGREGRGFFGKGGISEFVGQEDARGQNDGLDGLAEPPLQRLLAGQVRSQLQG